MMKIALQGRHGAGKFALVDDQDYERISAFKWNGHAAHRSLTLYARGMYEGRATLMHRAVIGAPDGTFVDHIDGNGLNNQRSNLRLCTQAENVRFGASRRAFDLWEAEL